MPRVELCQYCREKVDPHNDRFVVIHAAIQTQPRRVAHDECYQQHMQQLLR